MYFNEKISHCYFMSSSQRFKNYLTTMNRVQGILGLNLKGIDLKPLLRLHRNLLFKKKINLFIYFWLCQVFVAVRGLSLVAASGGYSSLQCAGFLLWWLLLLWSTSSRRAGFSSCGTRAQLLWLVGSRAQAQQLWRMGLVALRYVGSSQTRTRTRVPCIGRRIPNH